MNDVQMVKDRLPALYVEMDCLRRRFESVEEYEICARLRNQIKGINDFLLGYNPSIYDLDAVLEDFREVHDMIVELEVSKITQER